MRPTYGYRAYGLSIHSDLVLPELTPEAAGPVDITIRLRQAADRSQRANAQILDWPDVGTFVIDGTSTIDIEPAPGVSEPLLNLPLLGPVMALLLHLRGLLVLHASGAELDGRAVVFLGAKGIGKSTIAAGLLDEGHRLLADDVLALDFSDPAGPHVVPAFPQVKLVDDAADRMLLADCVDMPAPVPGFPKRQRRLNNRFSHARVPVGCIYVLARGDRAAIKPLEPHDALRTLICFSYISLFRWRSMSRSEASTHLNRCVALADGERVCRLEMPQDLDRIGEAVGLVERDHH